MSIHRIQKLSSIKIRSTNNNIFLQNRRKGSLTMKTYLRNINKAYLGTA